MITVNNDNRYHNIMKIPTYAILLVVIGGVSMGSAMGLVVDNENRIVNGEFKVTGGAATVDRTGGQSSIVVQNSGFANTIKFSDIDDAQIFQFRLAGDGSRLDIVDITAASAVRVAIESTTGQVGIGTSAPTETLDVNGNLRVRGNIVSTTDLCIGTCP